MVLYFSAGRPEPKVTSSMETPFSAQEWVVPNQMIPLTMQWTR